MVHDHVVPGPENPGNVLIRPRVERHAESGHAATRHFLHRFLGIVTQILRVAHIDVGRFAVGDHQQQFLGRFLQLQVMPGMADGRAHARGELAAHARQAGLRHFVVGLVEILEAGIFDVVAPVRAETVDREGVADLVDGVGQQHGGLALQVQHAVVLPAHLLVGGLRQVQQHHHRNVAHLAHRAHHDARVGLLPHADVDHGADGGVDVHLVAVFQLADARHALRLQGIEQELEAADGALVLRGDIVDQLQIAGLGALLQHRGPGRTFELDLVIPLRVMVGLGNRLLAFQFVERLAHVLVGEEFGAQHPDFFRIVAGGLDVDFVGELHQADVLAHLLGRFVTGRHGLVEIEFLEFPEVAVVVAIGRSEQIAARIEGDALGA